MSSSTITAVAIRAAVATASAAIGYIVGKRGRLSRQSMLDQILKRKAHSSQDPVMQYILAHSLRLHPSQERLIKVTKEHPRCVMLSSSDEMQFLCNLVKVIGAKKTIDVGVYTGYSAMSIALALPKDGVVVACDVTSEYPDIGKPYWKEAGVADKIDLRIAPAVDTLQAMVDKGESNCYDFAFIDADKPSYIHYYELCMKLVRSGGIIAIDNVLWGGFVANPDCNDNITTAVRALNEHVSQDQRVDISMINIGDGTTLVFKR